MSGQIPTDTAQPDASWWGSRRYGLFVHASIATVPAWAPVGQYSEWYRCHLGDEVADVLLHPEPMVEVLAHHRDRWGHIDQYDDFIELLTFDRFDAEDWARLAADAGMKYTVFVAKHHDGLCWWDAPNTERTTIDQGPRRNVLAEYAAACERNDITFGTYYSLLDWADDRYPAANYVDDVLHSHVTDLVERYGSRFVWGDGHWGHTGATWRSDDLLDSLTADDPELMVNDRWWATDTDRTVQTFEYEPPADITPGPWELCRGVGASFGHNRNEQAHQHMTAEQIVALLTEVVAKGGHLLLNVGPAADGTVPALQTDPIRAAGTWIRRHDDLINRSEPWTTWGDDNVRYLVLDGVLYAVDLTGTGHFSALSVDTTTVTEVIRVNADDRPPLHFVHDDRGLHLDLPRASPWRRSTLPVNADVEVDIPVYRIDYVDVEAPSGLFEPTDASPIPLGPLVADRRPGEIVQLGDGTYCGPADVPDGVIVRGLGSDRTRIELGGDTTAAVLTVHRSARVEHVRVLGQTGPLPWALSPAVSIEGQFATLLGCVIDGQILITGDDVLIRATTAGTIAANGTQRLTLSRCVLYGNRWNVGVGIVGGSDHDIDSCQIIGHLCAVRATDTAGTVIRGSHLEARWWGVHLERTERAHVHGNSTHRTMRAVDIDGGSAAVVDGNAVSDGDSGCIIERGAADCDVSGNHWERCRIGLLDWDSTGLRATGNNEIDLVDS